MSDMQLNLGVMKSSHRCHKQIKALKTGFTFEKSADVTSQEMVVFRPWCHLLKKSVCGQKACSRALWISMNVPGETYQKDHFCRINGLDSVSDGWE